MLVMRRRAGESFLIGGEIEIEILEVGATRVKLGITAPSTLSITRKEVLLTRSENLTAARSTGPEVIAWLSRKLGPQLSKGNGQGVDTRTPGAVEPLGLTNRKTVEGLSPARDMEGEDTSGIC